MTDIADPRPTKDMDQPPSLAAAQAEAMQSAPPQPPPTAGGLTPFVSTGGEPWDEARARHLVRRTHIGTPSAGVAAALAQTPGAAVDALVDGALSASMPPRPGWADLLRPPTGAPQSEIDAFNTANNAGNGAARNSVFDELRGARDSTSPLRERLALMWHGHLTADRSTYGNRCARLYRYWDILRTHALGDFRTMVRAMGTTQAMLLYLNGAQNRVGQPNENYAREILELFTTGIADPNGAQPYTQADITELARALTGWTAPSTGHEAVFVTSRHDTGSKTLFGVTGALNYATAHDAIFAQRADAVAHNVCTRIYRSFVHDAPNATVVAQMRAVFLPNFDIGATVRALLKSQHFFSDGARGALTRTPLDATLGLYVDSGYSNVEGMYGFAFARARDVGFELFRPPDVSGWDGGRTWLDTSRLPLRWLATDSIWARRSEARALANSVSSAPSNPYTLVDDLAAHVVAVPVSAESRAECVALMLGGIPDYEWNPNAGGSEARIRAALQFLTRLPEYQLF